MTRPRIADLFCGAGGAAMGLYRAGFEVVGFDIKPQKHYPFEFHQRDVMTMTPEELREFDAVWASPPCQEYSVTKSLYDSEGLPDLLPSTRELLLASGRHWILENVVGAPFHHYIQLCGMMFGLRTYRHRRFELSHMLFQPHHPKHIEKCLHGKWDPNWQGFFTITGGQNAPADLMREVMGIDWMTREELTQAIPPAYSEFLGAQLLAYLRHPAPEPGLKENHE